MPPTRALVHIDPLAPDVKSQVDGLKRISLLFDEIHYRVARGWRLKDDVAADPRRYQRGHQGNLLPVREFRPFVGGYNPLDDVFPAFVLDIQSWDPELRETVEALAKAGIAKPIEDDTVRKADPSNRIEHLRSLFVEADYKDEEFARLSGDHESASFTFGRFGLAPLPDGGEPSELLYIQFPPTFLDSITLTETLYLAHITSSNSVFLRPHLQGELDHRFRKFREGVSTLKVHAPEVAESLRLNAHFGEVSFNIANAIISSKLIASRSLEELLKFRAEMNDARRRFITTGLNEIDAMVSENAWSPAAKEEMGRYIKSKLTGDIIAYNDRTREVWEKLFGRAHIKLAKVATSTVFGGAVAYPAGGFLGNIMPNATGMSLLLIAALAGVAKEAPGFVRDLEEAIAEARKAKRSTIAYVAHLSKLN